MLHAYSEQLSVTAAAASLLSIAGIMFGMLPAIRAAKMDPVVALRYE